MVVLSGNVKAERSQDGQPDKPNNVEDDSDVEVLHTNAAERIKPLFKRLGLDQRPAKRLSHIGVVEDVDGDGNCGYSVLLKGLIALDAIEPYYRSINGLRQTLYEYASSSQGYFCGDPHQLRCFDADQGGKFGEFRIRIKKTGNRKRDAEAVRNYFISLLKPIWDADTDFTKRASDDRWFRAGFVAPIAALRFGVTTVVYSHRPGTTERTTVLHYVEGKNVLISTHAGDWLHPPPGSLCLAHVNQNHFRYIRLAEKPKRKTPNGKEIRYDAYQETIWADVPVGILEKKIVVTMEDETTLATVEYHQEYTTNCAKLIRDVLGDKIPSHIDLCFKHSGIRKTLNIRPGSQHKHARVSPNFLVWWDGWCSWKGLGCPTTFAAGIERPDIVALGNRSANHVRIGIRFFGTCCHGPAITISPKHKRLKTVRPAALCRPTTQDWQSLDEQLRKQVEDSFGSPKPSAHKQHEKLKAYAKTRNEKFMSYQTYHKWMDGTRKSQLPLPQSHIDTMLAFVEK